MQNKIIGVFIFLFLCSFDTFFPLSLNLVIVRNMGLT